MNHTALPNVRVAIWLQVLFIVAFVLLTYAYNVLAGGDRNFVHSLAASGCLVGLFYGYCYLIRLSFVAHKSRWSVPLLILFTAGLPLIVYVLVYFFLPAVGVVLYKPHIPFRLGEFLGKAIKALIIPWVAAALYAMFYRKQQSLRRNEELQIQNMQKQQQVVALKIKQRESVLQSHHFKNCLNSITARADDLKDDYIPSLIPHLSRVLGYALEDGDTPDSTVAIERELESLHWLIDSLRLRLKSADVVVIRQKGEPQGHPIPRLTLATLFENVTKHGTVSREKPATITIEFDADRFRFTCVNFVKPRAADAHPKGQGLMLLQVFLAQMKRVEWTLEHYTEADTFTICLTINYLV